MNSENKKFAKTQTPITKMIVKVVVIKNPCFALCFMREIFFAPKFCPAKVVMAIPKELIDIQKSASTFPKAAQAAAVSVPKELIFA